MIGNQLIHEIIVRDAIQRPDLVLNKLHCEIRRVLQQHESDTQDGMDIALVVIDKKQKSFEYSGAMNSIYYILENTETEIHEIAADKKPIGGRYFRDETERIFTYHTVQLPENEATTIYVFSDGYCDQFGGTENRKYMNRRFKENLLTMQNEPMKKQVELLDNNITAWMEQGKEKQIDDILVLGVKVK
jgi:serine phosphatase RsbU (regulator of sigma subunit)